MTTLINNSFGNIKGIDIPIKPIDIEKDIDMKTNDNEICDICFTNYSNKNIACSTCKNKICLDCCNALPSRAFSITNYDDNTEPILLRTFNPNDKCVAGIVWACPFCRCKNDKGLDDLSKNEILTLINKDYLRFTKTWDERELYKQTLIKMKERSHIDINEEDEIMLLKKENNILQEENNILREKDIENAYMIKDLYNRLDIEIAKTEEEKVEAEKYKTLAEKYKEIYNNFVKEYNIIVNVFIQGNIYFTNMIDEVKKMSSAKGKSKKDINRFLKTDASITADFTIKTSLTPIQ